MIGVRDHLELWNRNDWELRREELFANSGEIMANLRHSQEATAARPTNGEVR